MYSLISVTLCGRDTLSNLDEKQTSPPLQGNCSVGDINAFQSITTGERACADACDIVGNGEISQIAEIAESILSNCRHTSVGRNRATADSYQQGLGGGFNQTTVDSAVLGVVWVHSDIGESGAVTKCVHSNFGQACGNDNGF